MTTTVTGLCVVNREIQLQTDNDVEPLRNEMFAEEDSHTSVQLPGQRCGRQITRNADARCPDGAARRRATSFESACQVSVAATTSIERSAIISATDVNLFASQRTLHVANDSSERDWMDYRSEV